MIVLNGQLMTEQSAAISPLGDGFMTGQGVFTTMRVQAGGFAFFNAHEERLRRDAQAIGLSEVRLTGTLRARCELCLAANGTALNGLKIVRFADGTNGTAELIVPRPHGYGAATTARGLSVMTVNCSGRAGRELSRHKTLNYLEHARAKRSAVAAGFDEALWVTDGGVVLEGATTNLFAVIGGEVITPPVSAGILPGVARGVLLQLRGAVKVREAMLTREQLAEAAEIFVTNSLMGVVPVNRWDQRHYSIAGGQVTRELAAAFEGHFTV